MSLRQHSVLLQNLSLGSAMYDLRMLCSSLVLWREITPISSGLAAGNLLSLSLQNIAVGLDVFWDRVGPSRLTALTRLELIAQANISKALWDIQAIENLPLQELVLLFWRQVQLEPLFSLPGVLTSLRKLHIEDADCANLPSDAIKCSSKGRQQELERMSEAVFKLPKLCQLSGCSNVFDIGLRLGQGDWVEMKSSKSMMVSYRSEHTGSLSQMKTWIKPNCC